MTSTVSDRPPANANETQTDSERTLTIACCCLVGTTMILRTLGRYCLKLSRDRENPQAAGYFLGLDDVFNFLAVLTFFGLAVAELIAIQRGMGTHVETVLYYRGKKGLDKYNQAIYVCALFYNTVLGMVKLSVLALYRRLLRGASSVKLQYINWTAFVIVALNTSINVFVAAFQCMPVAAAFDSTVKGKCINASAFYLGNAITGIFTDTMVYGLSIPIVMPLQMDRRKKLAVLVTLLVGAFAVITSVVRLAFLPSLLKDPDITWAMGVPMNWSMIEPTVGIIVSSMPTIRAVRYLWISERKKWTGHTSQSSSKSHTATDHIQLYDMPGGGNLRKTTVTTGSDAKEFPTDNDSEERLVYGQKRGISKTTEVQLSYEPK